VVRAQTDQARRLQPHACCSRALHRCRGLADIGVEDCRIQRRRGVPRPSRRDIAACPDGGKLDACLSCQRCGHNSRPDPAWTCRAPDGTWTWRDGRRRFDTALAHRWSLRGVQRCVWARQFASVFTIERNRVTSVTRKASSTASNSFTAFGGELARYLDTDCRQFRSPRCRHYPKAAELADAGFARLGSGSLEWAFENGIVRPTTRLSC